jgi:hypothetical protein
MSSYLPLMIGIHLHRYIFVNMVVNRNGLSSGLDDVLARAFNRSLSKLLEARAEAGTVSASTAASTIIIASRGKDV